MRLKITRLYLHSGEYIKKQKNYKEIMTMLKKTNKKGFTLIELIIVIAIMAILIALLAPQLIKYIEKSKVGKDENSLDSVRLAVEAEMMDEKLSKYTTGVSDGKILGKPKDEADAKRMLTMLAGNTHSVFTGVTLVLIDKSGRAGELVFYEKTEHFSGNRHRGDAFPFPRFYCLY